MLSARSRSVQPLNAPRAGTGSGILVALVLAVAVVLAGPAVPASPTGAAPPANPASPAAASPAAANMVRLSIETKPVGATVAVRPSDGVTRSGRSPYSVEVPAGLVEVEFVAPGRVVRRETLDVRASTSVVRWLDPTGQLLAKRWEAKTGSNPKQVAFTPDGRELWVPLLGSREVQVFSAETGAVLATIALGSKGGAVEVIFSRDGSRAYVSQMETASVYEIDRVARKILRRFATRGNWTKVLALSPDEKTLYAANWVSDDVSEIDLASGAVRRLITTVDTPRGLVVSPDGRHLFVAGFQDGEIQRIDLSTGARATLLRTGGAMRHMVMSEASASHPGLLYADDMGTDQVFVVDTATLQVRRLAATDSHPNTIDLSPDGRLLFVSNRGQNGVTYSQPGPEWGSVLVIDAATGATLDAIVAGNQTTGLDVSPNGLRLAFTDFMDNRLALYDIVTTDVLVTGGGGRSATHRAELRKPTKRR